MVRDLALIGAGYWGKNLARNFNALGSLHSLCDLDQAMLDSYGADFAGVRKTSDIDRVFADVDIKKVAIAAPAALHHRLAKAALLAGKDVYVEKPLCLDVAEAEELVALAEQHRRILMVGHLLQYHPCVIEIQRMVERGELGRLQYITSNRLNLGKIRKEENALWSFAPHDISVILSLVGHRLPTQVRCVGEAYLTPKVADTTLTFFRFDENICAHVYVSWLNPFKEQKLTVVGSKGMLVFDDTKPWKEKLVVHRDYLTWADGRTATPKKTEGVYLAVPEQEPLLDECRHFIECCQSRAKPRTDGPEGLRVLQVLKAAQASLDRNGEAVVPLAIAQKTATASKPEYYAHSTAIIDAGAVIGKGSKIWHFAHVSAGAKIGDKCIFGQNTFVADGAVVGNNVKVQNNVAIYTGTTIEDDVFLGPSCVLTNVTNPRSQVNRHSLYEKTHIRRGATIGANATIVCGITLGRYCFIAAGAVVTKDVPDYALIQGVPGRQVGWMSRHGHPLRFDSRGNARCLESGFRYFISTDGLVSCLDLEEEAPMPEELPKGERTYDYFKNKDFECNHTPL
jgi:UDP-2-acetamido-3-amino-2,3-dideoxy-glucuronate N-acetyltransferase